MNIRPPQTQSIDTTVEVTALPTYVTRREHLRRELLSTVDSLDRRRADLVPEGFIEDYVALHWLEWSGGALHLTAVGRSISEQIRVRLKWHGPGCGPPDSKLKWPGSRAATDPFPV